MIRAMVVLILSGLLGQATLALASDKTISARFAVNSSVSVGMLGNYTNEGVGGTIGIGWRPFRDSRDIELTTSLNYDRFANQQNALGGYSFLRAGAGILLRIGPPQPNRVYLIFEGGPAFVRVDNNSGFPPYRGLSRRSTNLYGAGGAGLAFAFSRSTSLYVQIELVDILDTLFGDYRFFKLRFGLQI